MITPLSFDSSLFGYPVGKVVVSPTWVEEDFLQKARDFKLVYLFSPGPIQAFSDTIRLADVKITLGKSLDSESLMPEGLEDQSRELTEDLIQLALESGVYSRFKTDGRLVSGEFEKLYRLWIEKARENREIIADPTHQALVTVSVAGKMGKVGLLAVAPQYRGKGWGKRLVEAAESYAVSKGAQELLIPTQEDNIPAIGLYQAMGYREVQREYIYHYWRSLPADERSITDGAE